MDKQSPLLLVPTLVFSAGLLLLSSASTCFGFGESTRLETVGREKRDAVIHGECFRGNIKSKFVGCFVTQDGWALFMSDSICLSESMPVFTLSNGDKLPPPRITLIDTNREIVVAKFAIKPATWCEINFEPVEIDTWVAIVDGSHQFPIAIGPVLALRPVSPDGRKDFRCTQELSIGSKLYLYQKPFPERGSPMIDEKGNLRGLYSGMSKGDLNQTIILAKPIAGCMSAYDRALESDESIELPVDEDTCPYDPVMLDPDFTEANLMVMKNKAPLAELGRLERKYPESLQVLIFKLGMENSADEMESAIQHYRNNSDLPPTFRAMVYSTLALKREQEGDPHEAVDAYLKAIEAAPEGQDPLQTRYKLSRAYLQLEDYENALKFALESCDLYPDQISLQNHLYKVYNALGAREERDEVYANVKRLASIYEIPLPSVRR